MKIFNKSKIVCFLFFINSLFFYSQLLSQDSLSVSTYMSNDLKIYPIKVSINIFDKVFGDNDLDSILKYCNVCDSSDYIQHVFQDDSKIGFNSNIIPALEYLENGKYIMYYENIPLINQNSILSNQIACIFEIKNNEPNGMSYWFSPIEQKLFKKGAYLNGDREGVWRLFYEYIYFDHNSLYKNKKRKKNVSAQTARIYHSCNYTNGLKNGFEQKSNDIINEKIQFVMGKKQGRYEFLNGDSIQIEGSYKNNEKSGEWSYYIPTYLNDNKTIKKMILIERFIINDKKTPITKNIELGNFVCSQNVGYSIVDGFFSSGYNFNIYSSEIYDDIFIDDFSSHIIKNENIDSYFKYLEYEKYYNNGQLYLKYKVENGNFECKNFNIFYKDGKIKCQFDFESDSVYCLKKVYNECNQICNSFYIESLGQVDFLYKNIEGKIYIEYANYCQYHYSNVVQGYEKYSKDTMSYLLSQILDKKNNIIFQKKYRPNNKSGEIFDSQIFNNFVKKGTFYFDSSYLTTNYQQNIKLGPFSISFQTIDSLEKNKYFPYYDNHNVDSLISLDIINLGFSIDTFGKSICILNDRLFNGNIKFIFSDSIEFNFQKKHSKYYFYIKANYQNLELVKSLFPSIKDQFPYSIELNNFFINNNCKNQIKLKSIDIPFKNGKINGDIICKSDINEIIKSIYVVNNLVNGKVKSYWYDFNEKRYLGRIEEYKDNQLDGWYTQFNEKGIITSKTLYPIPKFTLTGTKKWKDANYLNYEHSQEYINGIKNGKYERIDNIKKVKWIANYVNDTLNGNFYVYNKDRLVGKGKFINGFLEDTVFFFDTLSQIEDMFIYYENRFLKHINYVNKIKHFQITNTDTINTIGFPNDKYYTGFLYNNSIGRYKKNIRGNYNYYDDYNFDLKTGYYTHFFRNGKPKYFGKLEGSKKVGQWHYNDSINGTYSIFYKDSIILVNDSFNLMINGIFKQYDINGNLLSKKYVSLQDEVYNCSQNETYDILNFYVIYERDTSLHLKNGLQKWYYPTGVLQSKGLNQNGLPTGTWMYYHDDGSLKEIGEYQNGLKSGRWISGDLSKIHYTGDICVDFGKSNMQDYLRNLEENVNLTVTYYKNGEQLSQEFFEFKANK